ncbi:cardiolipin synthase [Alteribacillus persepolensis]|uniref:Cardiolipin synthase n=1 Tax=Alteribacillus persepolensis TaxID=568899 RepID=A0A1G8G2M6_9BACI|nr:cardiolipin synthase [Alteribacillus persepolensis]SDH88632.1 cardiolipin synthase [Alteribacillus persepolensis]
MFVFYLVIIVLLIILCFRLDFLLGEKNYQKKNQPAVYPTRHGQLDFLDTGKTFFDTLFNDIRAAKTSIHILFFIFRNDSLGSQLIDLLVEKADEGVEIKVLLDRVGAGLDKKGKQRLRDANVSFAYAKSPSFPYLFFTFNQRNHRKITVVDGKIGYLGGFNVGDEYLGRDPKLGLWRDFHLRFEGEGVQDLQTQFLRDWEEAGNLPTSADSYFPSLEEGTQPFHFISTEGEGLEALFFEHINKAQTYIYIASPYFIPSSSLQRALCDAAKRGVEICIILPEKKDHPFVKEASFKYIEELLKHDVKVFHFQQGFFHAKALLIDDTFCDVGTANFDRRSFDINSEMNTIISDSSVITLVKQRLETDMKQSTLVSDRALQKRSFSVKIREKLARIVEPLL